MTIHLPTDLQNRVEAVVDDGQFASVDEAMAQAARLLLSQVERVGREKTPDQDKDTILGSIGSMRHAADELDEIVVDAYLRRNQPWRDVAIE